MPRPGHAPVAHRRQRRVDRRLRLGNDHDIRVRPAYNWSVHSHRGANHRLMAEGREHSRGADVFAPGAATVPREAGRKRPENCMTNGLAAC
jgi:hypothetical protein